MQRKTSSILICLLALAASCNCAFAACPSADLNGDCLVNFLDFPLMALENSLLDLHTLARQWLRSGEDDAAAEPLTLLGRVDMQTDEPNSFAVQFVVVGKRRVARTVFEYECEVILTNLSPIAFENVQLVMVSCPDNITTIDRHVTFGGAQIAPGESAASMDTCAFTVERTIPIDPLEIVWRYVTAPEDMVFIPGGHFQMGDSFSEASTDERVHTVTLDSFCMGKYEVTNRQYCDYLNSALAQAIITIMNGVVYKPSSGEDYPYCDILKGNYHSQIDYNGLVFSVRTKNARDMSNDPMVQVSWYGAVAYCNWRSQQEGKEICYNTSDPNWPCDFSKNGYRLPTEAEWEYAARSGLSGRRFPWGDTISHSQANYYSYWEGGHPYNPYDVNPTEGYHPSWDDVSPYTSPGGSFAANSYGLYDMVGNAWELCNDWYGRYSSASQTNPTGPMSGTHRVLRGGCWVSDAYNCRVSHRFTVGPKYRSYVYGFRPVLDS
jgi:formylglycine-generating enzyme required for sulfatase activity